MRLHRIVVALTIYVVGLETVSTCDPSVKVKINDERKTPFWEAEFDPDAEKGVNQDENGDDEEGYEDTDENWEDYFDKVSEEDLQVFYETAKKDREVYQKLEREKFAARMHRFYQRVKDYAKRLLLNDR